MITNFSEAPRYHPLPAAVSPGASHCHPGSPEHQGMGSSEHQYGISSERRRLESLDSHCLRSPEQLHLRSLDPTPSEITEAWEELPEPLESLEQRYLGPLKHRLDQQYNVESNDRHHLKTTEKSTESISPGCVRRRGHHTTSSSTELLQLW